MALSLRTITHDRADYGIVLEEERERRERAADTTPIVRYLLRTLPAKVQPDLL